MAEMTMLAKRKQWVQEFAQEQTRDNFSTDALAREERAVSERVKPEAEEATTSAGKRKPEGNLSEADALQSDGAEARAPSGTVEHDEAPSAGKRADDEHSYGESKHSERSPSASERCGTYGEAATQGEPEVNGKREGGGQADEHPEQRSHSKAAPQQQSRPTGVVAKQMRTASPDDDVALAYELHRQINATPRRSRRNNG